MYLRHVISTGTLGQLCKQDVLITKYACLKILVLNGLFMNSRLKMHILLKKADYESITVLMEVFHSVRITKIQ